MKQKNSFFQKYELLNSNNMPCILGIGAYSTVQLAINKKTLKKVAIKKIYKKQPFNQVSIQSSISKHPNITQLIEFFYDSEKNSSFIVLEYIQNGTLLDFMEENSALNLQKICQAFIGICKGVQAIHQVGIMHRDIKPANVVFDKNWNTKICDFGCAIKSDFSDQVCGTFEYMAPQMLQRKQYDRKIDIWAIGVTMYEVLEKKLPFNHKQIELQLEKMKQPLIFKNGLSVKFAEIIKKTLNFNPQLRPQITEIISTLQKISKQTFQQETFLSIKKLQHLNIYESQNSTIDSKDYQQNETLKIKNTKKSTNLNKVLSLKYIRPFNQKIQIPKITISKPQNQKRSNQKIYLAQNYSHQANKISIKQLIRRKNIKEHS